MMVLCLLKHGTMEKHIDNPYQSEGQYETSISYGIRYVGMRIGFRIDSG